MKINFTKMHGLGNDFMVVDCISQTFAPSTDLVRALGDRHFGVGFDQLLLVEAGSDADFNYRIFNADGSEVEQCGNGVRCFASFVLSKNLTDKTNIRVRTKTGIVNPVVNADGSVRVDMGVPDFAPAASGLLLDKSDSYQQVIGGVPISFNVVSMGNPHAVIVVDELANAAVELIGTKLGTAPIFANGANIGFMQIVDSKNIKLRVFERGAGETLACGTGACAAVAAGICFHGLEANVCVQLAGGDLQIDWKSREASLYMSGSASHVFEGSIEINEFKL